ncbi:isochorismatase family protein [Burkholderia sp. Ac-20379]|uniref:isochorismatase family protein n=1 Tax=Burkholderia sp. Ac-20379 TaxID=2703900 RepID=UPI0019817967|nr:isochorismatase family protein [Burkholderia sp. Ac-20379]MBN3725414.1 isochorismatase family protein [Burkholderia sp. Ac-20379]
MSDRLDRPYPARALLIVDMQHGLFHGADAPYEGERLLANLQTLIARAREAGALILAARHVGAPGTPLAPDSALVRLLPELGLDPQRDIVFDKQRPNCFSGTALAAQLAEAGVRELAIAGMKTQYCVDTTCRAAPEHGIRPVLVADAHSCMDTPVLPAAAIVAHHNLTLAGPFADVLATHDCHF